MNKKRLGRGLGALLDIEEDKNFIKKINISKVLPSKTQPRKYFNDDTIVELAESIKKFGILNPIIVKPENGKFKIISGERRYRAAQIAGLNEIPVIIKDEVNEKVSFEISLIENIHREDLNPLEEAESFKKLIEEFNYTHQQIAELVGKDRTYVTNMLRLLKLTDFVKANLIKGNITVGHCKIMVNLPEEKQNELCELIIKNNLSVREAEKFVSKLKDNIQKRRDNIAKVLFYEEFKDYFNTITKKFNTKVDIDVGKKGRGKLLIFFKNKEELKKILDELLRKEGEV